MKHIKMQHLFCPLYLNDISLTESQRPKCKLMNNYKYSGSKTAYFFKMRNGWHGLGESLLLKDRRISLSALGSNAESPCPSLWQRGSEKKRARRETTGSGRFSRGGFAVLVSDCTINVPEVVHVWSVYPLCAPDAGTDVTSKGEISSVPWMHTEGTQCVRGMNSKGDMHANTCMFSPHARKTQDLWRHQEQLTHVQTLSTDGCSAPTRLHRKLTLFL